MKTIELNAAPRADFGKKASKGIRKSGSIPCVMYGGKYGEDEALHFQIKEDDLRGLLYTPNVYLVNLTLEGKSYKAILKEAQFHPVKEQARLRQYALCHPAQRQSAAGRAM